MELDNSTDFGIYKTTVTLQRMGQTISTITGHQLLIFMSSFLPKIFIFHSTAIFFHSPATARAQRRAFVISIRDFAESEVTAPSLCSTSQN